jgi:hypothetical protein
MFGFKADSSAQPHGLPEDIVALKTSCNVTFSMVNADVSEGLEDGYQIACSRASGSGGMTHLPTRTNPPSR